MYGKQRSAMRRRREKAQFLVLPANETFFDVKKILARWLWEMLTKKRLPERWEIFCCCCLPCLLHIFEANLFFPFCAKIILCVGKFTSACDVERVEWDGKSDSKGRIYIYYTSFCSRNSSETPKKKNFLWSSFLSCHFISFKKSFSFCFARLAAVLEERYISWDSS